jgi:DNA-binding NarL/FixJ family response regulator
VSSAPPVRVAVVSKIDVVATGLSSLLGRHADRVDVVDVEAGFGAPDPDVVLYDVAGLADRDGGDLERLVKETTSAVVAVTNDLRPDLGSRALALGADGFFSLAVNEHELVEAVVAAAQGADGEREPGRAGVLDFDARQAALGHDVGLTPREVDVLALITRGLSNQQIAEQTYLSINSVKTYIRTAYRRIGVTSRSQAVVWCLQHGFAAEGSVAVRPAASGGPTG